MEEYKRWNDVPQHFKSQSYCNKERLSLKGVNAVARVYQKINNTWIDLYDITQLKSKKPLTEKQIQAKEKAQATRRANYTCGVCGTYNTRTVDRETKVCVECRGWYTTRLNELIRSNEALEERLSWSEEEKINGFVILDTETTGLYQDHEVIEIAIMDLKGDVLYNSLIKPTRNVPDDAIQIHGITNEMVAEAPTIENEIDKIDAILQGKVILAYNSEFDSYMVYISLAKYGINREFAWLCVMKNEMEIWQSDRFISLAAACSMEKWQQGHRALSDCQLVYQLVTDRDWILNEIKNNKEEIEEMQSKL
ncbi:3'-5' exonuclease [Clostridium sp.]|uniref:3'-5' exonuclease n=1 Tax=Clostridium sp. TaxID=1506 RepID=UPI003F3733AB